MKKSILFGGVSAVLLASGALYAAPGAGKMKIDADGNGTVSKSEAMAGADARFAKMDANNDGTLNQADRAAKVKERFATMDADKNGAVSEPEFVAAHEERMAKREDRREMRGERKGPGHKGHRMGGRSKGGGMRMLAKADTNGDKSVTQAEFRAAAEARFAKFDANNDGSISADERKAQRQGMRGNRPAPAVDAN